MRRPLLVLFAAVFLVAVGCGDDDDAPAADSPPEVGTDDGADITSEDEEANQIATVADLALLLDDVAGGCALEYEGLVDDQREVSICTLGDEIAELSVWEDTDALDAVVASAEGSGDPVVAGPNWTVDVTGTALAGDVAEATGGSVTS